VTAAVIKAERYSWRRSNEIEILDSPFAFSAMIVPPPKAKIK